MSSTSLRVQPSVVVGGRLGYCLFYKPGYYLAHPLEVFAIWQGGMSFHGGLLGVIGAMLWFAHSRGRRAYSHSSTNSSNPSSRNW